MPKTKPKKAIKKYSTVKEVLAQITAPHFCAAVVFNWPKTDPAVVVDAAPILRWMCGKYAREVRQYCQRKGWAIQYKVIFSNPDPAG